jgi:hypothetical protein
VAVTFGGGRRDRIDDDGVGRSQRGWRDRIDDLASGAVLDLAQRRAEGWLDEAVFGV